MPRGRRRTELTMLIFAVAVVMFAYASVGLGLNGKVPSGMFAYGLSFAVIVGAAHLAVRRLAPWSDPLMLPLAALLNGLGIVMIYRLQESGRGGNAGNAISTMTTSTTALQVMWSAVGIAAFVVVLALIRQPRILQRYTYTLGAIGLVLLVIPALLPTSMSEINGAKVWIIVGGLEVQPGEFAKLALAVFFAGYLVSKRDVLALAGRRVLGIDLPRARDLGPGAHRVGRQPPRPGLRDRRRHLRAVLRPVRGDAVRRHPAHVLAADRRHPVRVRLVRGQQAVRARRRAVHHLAASVHVDQRVLQPCHPAIACRPTSSSQGLYGLGFGGVLGRGLGQGQPYWTPLAQSDFIFTAFGEELGVAGLMAILLIYGLIVQRGLRAAVAVRDPFSKLLAGGLAFVLALQVFVIVGGVTRLIPLTGITTPFLSQGGSSLVASWMMIALLMRISDTARRPAPQPIQDEGMTQVVRAG